MATCPLSAANSGFRCKNLAYTALSFSATLSIISWL